MGKSSKLYSLALAALDVLLVNLGFAAAFGLRFNLTWPEYNLQPYLGLIPWLSLTAVIVFYMFDLYEDWRRKSIYNLYYGIILSIAVLTLCTMALSFWYRGFAFPRSVMALATVFQVLFISASRSALWFISKRFFGRKKVLIIADSKTNGIALAEKFLDHAKGWFVVEDLMTEADLAALKRTLHRVDVVLLTCNLKNKVEIINRCTETGKEVLLVPDLLDMFILGSEPQQVDDMMVLSITPPKLIPSQMLLKRVFDIVISLVSIVILSPVMLTLCVLIPLTSKGPAIFRQERAGRAGKVYQMLKFRSMVQDAEKQTGPVLASNNDQRVTPMGKFIRNTRLDELPQLFNVLKGDMSLVGPRPERPYFIKQFQESIPYYTKRLAVKPGITGMAQVMAKYSTTAEDKLRFDLMYVKHYSLALDIKILLQTIRVVLQREQAEGLKTTEQNNRESLQRLFG